MCSSTLVWEVLAWGFFLLISENKRLEGGSIEAIWRLWYALIPVIYLCFCFGNCHTDELLSLRSYSWVQVSSVTTCNK